MTGRRVKLILVLAGIALSGLQFLAWTQEWFTLTIDDGSRLAVTGDVAAPAISTLALTNLVLIGALSIAGPVFRVILGILQSLLGVTVLLSGVIALGNPAVAGAGAVTGATGISGSQSVETLVTAVALTAWPYVATVAGALLIAVGAAVVITGRSWPGSARKYSAVRTEPEAGGTRVDDWDALSAGDDPT